MDILKSFFSEIILGSRNTHILWSLIFAHFLADFTFQTNYIAQWKEKNIWGRWAHVIIFFVIAIILVFPVLNDTWFVWLGVAWNGWICIIVLTLLHLLEDHFRIWCVQKKHMPDNILFFIYDQFVHVGLVIIFIPQIAAPLNTNIQWMQLGILFVLNTHFTTILVYYLEKTFFTKATMLFKEKYLSILERLIIAGAFLIPVWWWLVGVIAWIGYNIYVKLMCTHERTWINFITSYFIACLTGILARLILFP